MKKLALSNVLLLSCLLVTGQGDYLMYETMYIRPKSDKLEECYAALAAHNQKFHAEGPAAVTIQRVMNGSRTGQLAWVMGPLTFSDLDNRPSDQAHSEDWNGVMKYIEEVTEAEYWRMDPDLSYTPEGWTYDSKIHIRFWELRHGSSDELIDILKKIVEVFRTKQYDHSWHLYWNYFQTGNGRDIAGVFGFDNWAFYDEDPLFLRDFEEIHGEGSWEETYDALIKVTAGMTEELREVIPELGVLQYSKSSL